MTELLFLVRRSTALQLSLVAVERVAEYAEDLMPEERGTVFTQPSADWPSSGAIQVKNLSVRYDPSLPNVLHNVSFSVLPGEKIGIVGPTGMFCRCCIPTRRSRSTAADCSARIILGSGKSTIALSLFRFMEFSSGSIHIDDLNISDLSLHDLRSSVGIIPQDPTILSGTLRSTLDMLSEVSRLPSSYFC